MYTVLQPFGSIKDLESVLAGRVNVCGVSSSPAPEKELAEKLAMCDILIADVDIKVDKQLIEKAKNLKAVLCTSVGVDYVDVDALNERGIILANNPDFCSNAVAEFTMGLIYALLRRIPAGTEAVKANRWETRDALGGVELFGRTLGLVAFGRIGREVARQALGIGMKVLAYSPHLNQDVARSIGVIPVTFDELLRTADIVSLHMPFSDKTKHIIGAAEFALMKKDAYLINVARGGVVDEKALLEAIRSGNLSGAALDVLEHEPPEPGDPAADLMKSGNVIITPHVAWYSYDAERKALHCVRDQVESLLRGELPGNCLNREVAMPFSVNEL